MVHTLGVPVWYTHWGPCWGFVNKANPSWFTDFHYSRNLRTCRWAVHCLLFILDPARRGVMLDTKKSMNECSSSATQQHCTFGWYRVNRNIYNRAGHSKSVINHSFRTVVGKHMVVKLFTRSAAPSITNKRIHSEQNNVAHNMDAGGKWKTMNQLGVA